MADGEVELRLNPALKASAFRAAYERDGIVQVPNLFEPAVADALAQVLERETPWRLMVSSPEGRQLAYDLGPQADARKLTEEVNRALAQTREGFGYVYLGYDMIDAYLQGRDPGHPLHVLSETLNTPEFLEFTRGVIGGERPTKCEAFATRMRQGDYLGWHDDSYLGQRRAAFTIGFTRRWRSDWGGQLLLHTEDGEVWRGLKPGFNVLTLFKAPQPHSVAVVAPYAGAHRLSIVGFLRGDPPGKG